MIMLLAGSVLPARPASDATDRAADALHPQTTLLKQDRTKLACGAAAMRIAFFHICGKHIMAKQWEEMIEAEKIEELRNDAKRISNLLTQIQAEAGSAWPDDKRCTSAD
jgi:hypothetical protein